MSKRYRSLIGLIATAVWAASVTLQGCATLRQHEDTARLVVTYSTLRYLEGRDDPASRAARIREVAQQIKGLASGESVALAALEAAARAHVAQIASPADRMLAGELVTMIAAEIAARTEGGLLSGERLVYTRQVMDWVIAAAAAY